MVSELWLLILWTIFDFRSVRLLLVSAFELRCSSSSSENPVLRFRIISIQLILNILCPNFFNCARRLQLAGYCFTATISQQNLVLIKFGIYSMLRSYFWSCNVYGYHLIVLLFV
ncbi:hypothetical protein RchiOBHm_Chr5g0076071 [Rosa chinensis]|uniref:Uncharacterized protein n=1 Tax=Rosa chinensis TaxID=74649 RepID=A0A2P6QLM8_ROSCH|nr:hypothetical protein RchiOBHm_Chr5g0076071 [Rosa chinensis]